MTQSVQISPPNSLILVLDPDTGALPDSLGGNSIAASPSGLAIGTLNEFDGQTTVNLATPSELPSDQGLSMRWQGAVSTSGRIGILNVHSEVLLEASSPESANVAIWTNDPNEPSVIWVLVS
jgi:hypothetical protein